MAISERTKRMMNGYLSDFMVGMNNYEISAKYSLSVDTVYKHLEEIAKRYNMSRSEFLQRYSGPHKKYVLSEKNSLENRTVEETLLLADEIVKESKELMNKIEKML